MSCKRGVLVLTVLLCMCAVTPTLLFSQATTSGTVTGAVSDPTGALVPGAEVTLVQQGTNATQTRTTDSAGRYLFPAVNPGMYTVKCTAKGFRTTAFSQVQVEVLKSVTIDFKLELGAASQVVEVMASTGAELQTTDAAIGTVIGGDMLLRLPALARSVTSALMMQPAVSPSMPGMGDVNGGQVAGANVDQTTFYVDGGDATSDLEGTNGYVSPPGEPQPAPFIAVPAETTQEFRVVTANPTASFARSQGGEVAILTKSGTNAIHGSTYEYYYGNATSANSWLLNSVGRKQPHSVNNRFGTSVGGPIFKDKLFVFGNYEGRRFYQNATITQVVPTDSARAGILKFRDCALGFGPPDPITGVRPCLGGNTVSYDLATSTACGTTAGLPGGQPCDPRGIGISPLIQTYLRLLPEPNNFTVGDTRNSAGFTAAYAQPQIEDLGVVRLDYNFSSKWNVFATYHYNRYNIATTDQFDVTKQQLISGTPVQPRFVTFMLQGTVGSHLTTQTHGSYMRDWWGWNRAPVVPQLPGTAGALQVSGEGRLASGGSGKSWGDTINYNTQNARARLWAGKDYFAAEDATWLRGTHTYQFGGGYYLWKLTHMRTDVVTGGLTGGPIYWVGQNRHNGGSFLDLTSAQRIPTCDPSAIPPITTNCLRSSDVNRYITQATSLMGLLDRSSQVGTRDGDFNASPLGSSLIDHVTSHTFATYFQDSWKIKPLVTLTYGLSYGVQFAPTEQDGKQVLQVFGASNEPLLNARAYFQQRNAALTSGLFFASGAPTTTCNTATPPVCTTTPGFANDSTFGFSPIRHVPGRSSSATTSWRDFGPRVAVAWNVPYSNRIFGNKQTVIRAGYSILWNRNNGVQEALTPLLGDGLATVVVCAAPTFNGTSTATCNPGTRINASNGFRIGVDGSTVPIPAFSNAPIPLIPGSPFGLSRTSIQDPGIRQAYSHNVSLDIQRAFAHNWFVDVGYIGKFARNLWQNVDINAADAFAKNGGQTLAQAFDALALAARGQGPSGALFFANGTFNTAYNQPFFENAPYGCAGCTEAAAGDTADLIVGSLASFMLFNADFILPQPLDPMQAVLNNMTTDGGIANYNAGFISVRKSMSQGLDLSANYTWSHAVGTAGQSFLGQQYTFYSPPTPFNFFSGWGSNNGDRRHVINATWYYLLPFGKGRHYSTSSNIFNRIVGGWYSSGIWTWSTGLPACIGADGDYGAVTGFTCAVGPTLFGKAGRHNGVSGSGGIGTDGTINLFANPEAVYNSLSRPLLSVNGRPNAENLNLPRSWNLDLAIGKNILSTERYKMLFTAEAFNVFNHPLFCVNFGCSLDISDQSGFGVLNSADNDPRKIQLGLRFEF